MTTATLSRSFQAQLATTPSLQVAYYTAQVFVYWKLLSFAWSLLMRALT